jgi:hypothetical protein
MKCTEVGWREVVEEMLAKVNGIAGLLEVSMLEQLLGRRAAVGVLVQAARHQIEEGLGQQWAFLIVVGAGRGQLEAVVDHSCWTQVIIGRFAEGQLQAQDAEGPDVDGIRVAHCRQLAVHGRTWRGLAVNWPPEHWWEMLRSRGAVESSRCTSSRHFLLLALRRLEDVRPPPKIPGVLVAVCGPLGGRGAKGKCDGVHITLVTGDVDVGVLQVASGALQC